MKRATTQTPPRRRGAGAVFTAASALAGGWLTTTTPLAAQQATDMPAAVQPGWELLIVRQEAMVMRLDDPRPAGFGAIDMVEFETTLAYGTTRDTAVMVHVPVMFHGLGNAAPDPETEGWGLDDLPVMFQWRFYQEDVGPIETRRAVLLAGVEVPSYDDGFSSESFDPLLGLAYTRIDGRHGFNASALWKFNTGAAADFAFEFGDTRHDALRLDASYLYRLAPEAYTADSFGSHYFQVQLLGRYETNGDTQLMVAPGWMYEDPRWAFEATVHLPAFQDLDGRAELEWGFNVGLRYLF